MQFAALVGATGEDEVFVAAGLVEVAGHDDGAVIGSWFAVNETLGIESLGSATAIGDQFGNVAGVDAHEPGELKHFTEGHAAKVQFEAGDDYVVAPVQQAFGEEEKVGDKLAFVDGDAFNVLAYLLLSGGEDRQDGPRVGVGKLYCFHPSAAIWVAAFYEAGCGLGVGARFE